MTIQHGDLIFIDGMYYNTFTPILDSCPTAHLVVKRISLQKALETGWDFNTSMNRGYFAKWIVVDSTLYLSEVEGVYQLNSRTLTIADWFTGDVVLGGGNSIDCDIPIKSILCIVAGKVTPSFQVKMTASSP